MDCDYFIDRIRLYADNISYNDFIAIEVNEPRESITIGRQYDLSEYGSGAFARYYLGNGSPYYTTLIRSDTVSFLRLDAAVAAGIFSFKAFHSSGDSMVITERRFDIRLA